LDAAVKAARNSEVAFVAPVAKRTLPDGSNGDRLVVVVRYGTVVTLMFRRATQPMHAGKFNVARVTTLPEA
jgi:hypothetical protein